MSLGTPHYMAPEQAMGEREITPKADVYALGCVLYEMLTGEPPFTGPTAQAIVARVMTEQPRALTLQRHTIPPHVDAAVRVALEKLPADRFATAAQFAEALARPGMVALPATAAREVPAPLAPARRRVGALLPWALVVVLAAISGVSLWKWLGSKPEIPLRPLVRFGIQLPREAAPAGALGSTIAFSPDGSRFVYVGTGPSNTLLYSRGLDQLRPVAIPGSEGGILPFFSHSGQDLGFKQGTRLMRVALAGGPVAVICRAAGSTYGATWTTRDTIIFATDSGLMEVPALGGEPQRVARPDSGEQFMWPEILPGDRTVLFAVLGRGTVKLAALDRRTASVTRMQQTGSYPRYVTAGFLVINDPTGSVSAVPFDARLVAVTGPAMPLADMQSGNAIGDQNLGVSRSGDFAYQTATSAGNRLVLVDRSGAAREAGADTGYYYGPRLSPDGKRVAVTRQAGFASPNTDVWIVDLIRHTRTRLTFDTAASWPVWTPDGRRVAYARAVSAGGTHVYWAPADGSGAAESLVTAAGQWFPAVFEPSGRGLVYHGLGPQQAKGAIWQVGLADRAPHQVLATAFHNYDPSLSPDGRWMAYHSDESGRFEVYVRPFPGPGGRWQVSLNGGTEPVWSPTGREIFYRSGDAVMAATVRTQGAFEVGSSTRLFDGLYAAAQNQVTDYDVSRDGRTFVMLQRVQGAEQSVFVTLNWFDQVRARAR
jgi:serine/threonine-protein kinase